MTDVVVGLAGTTIAEMALETLTNRKVNSLSIKCCRSLTLAIPTIPTKITPTRVLQLTGAFGAFADHRGHDRAGDVRAGRALLFTKGARGIRMSL